MLQICPIYLKNLNHNAIISNWNTNILSDISFLFYHNYSLKSIPDISNWKTVNIENFSHILNF